MTEAGGLEPFPLRGRVALVTGVSRRAGIGYAIARRLATLGASLFLPRSTTAGPAGGSCS